MKKIFLVFFCTVGLVTAHFAQNAPSTKQDVQTQRAVILEQVTAAAREVGSGDKEIEKLKSIFENLFKKQDQIKADSSFTQEVKKEKLKEANSEKDWKLKNLLGDKYNAYAEVRKRQMAEAAPPKQ